MPDDGTLLPQCYIRLDGADAPPTLMGDLIEVTVESTLHLPDVATLILHDHDLNWTDGGTLDPGKAVVVEMRSGQSRQVVFDGEIVEVELDMTAHVPRLIVRAFDRLHRLARGRRARSFVNVTDGDLVHKIAGEAGLTASADDGQVQEYVLQSDQTDLEFLRQRAIALGNLLYVQGKTLHCEPPGGQGQAVTLEWGVNLTEFSPRLTTVDQVNEVTVRSWDPTAKQAVVGQASSGQGIPAVGESRTGSQIAQTAFGSAPTLVADRPLRSQGLAEKVAQAVANRAAERFIEAEGTCQGQPAIVAGASVTIKGVGTRFGGSYFVTNATHEYTVAQSYTTRFSISGQHPATLLGLLAGPPQLQKAGPALAIGVVTNAQDPNGLGRVKVKFPWLSDQDESDWARVVTPGGGPQRGLQFIPEVNDEVLVGFEQGDIHCAYVLGGLWNGQDAPPKKSDQLLSSDGKVQERIIRSRSGHVITLDDTDGSEKVSVVDKSGNKVVIDSAANKLTIEVQGDTEITAKGSVTITAQDSMTLQAQNGVTLQAQTGQVQVQGMGVKVDGGPATVDVSGSMVNLNS